MDDKNRPLTDKEKIRLLKREIREMKVDMKQTFAVMDEMSPKKKKKKTRLYFVFLFVIVALAAALFVYMTYFM